MEVFDVYSLNNEQMEIFCNVIVAYRNYNFTDFTKNNFHIGSAKPNYDDTHKIIFLFDKNGNKVKLKENVLTLFNFCSNCWNKCYENYALYNDENLIICQKCTNK